MGKTVFLHTMKDLKIKLKSMLYFRILQGKLGFILRLFLEMTNLILTMITELKNIKMTVM